MIATTLNASPFRPVVTATAPAPAPLLSARGAAALAAVVAALLLGAIVGSAADSWLGAPSTPATTNTAAQAPRTVIDPEVRFYGAAATGSALAATGGAAAAPRASALGPKGRPLPAAGSVRTAPVSGSPTGS